MQAAALVYKVICAQAGQLELSQLTDNLSGQIQKDELEQILGNKQLFVVCSLDGKRTVIAKTQLKLCKAWDCNGCSNLHLCKLYLFGKDCQHYQKKQGCRFSHDLYSDHNSQVLQQHHLQELCREELGMLLLQNDTLMPQICFDYNKGTGVFGSCSNRDTCSRLHICQKYLRGTCHTGHCDKSHDFFEPQPKRLLQSKGVEMVKSLLAVYQNIQAMWDSTHNPSVRSRGGPKGTEICLFYIKNFCKDGDRCEQVHFNLPYRWEFKDGQGWMKFTDDDNEATEKDYYDPSMTHSGRNVPVHFDTMTRKSVAVRRISTLSSVIRPNFILTTKWVWYWQDDSGQWIPYGSSQKGAQSSSSITSEDLEKTYQKDNKAIIDFTTKRHAYKLYMQDMIQCNTQLSTKRLVRRRPVFVSAADVQKIKSSSVHIYRDMPPQWDKLDMPETGFKRVKLESCSKEYTNIAERFNKTMPDFRVTSIERVQNLGLWKFFQWQANQMKKTNSGNTNETIAFHGTNSKHVDNICRENVDWRVCGTHGTSYGEGSYFARDAKRSHNYTSPSGTRSMFACRVLLGEYTLGNPKYKRPPPKEDDPTVFYDSCVNRMSNPSIFVVFERHQVYPEYLIQYTETTQSRPVQVSQNIPSRRVLRESSSFIASSLSSSALPGSKTSSSFRSSFDSKLAVTSCRRKKTELPPVPEKHKLRRARLSLLLPKM